LDVVDAEVESLTEATLAEEKEPEVESKQEEEKVDAAAEALELVETTEDAEMEPFTAVEIISETTEVEPLETEATVEEVTADLEAIFDENTSMQQWPSDIAIELTALPAEHEAGNELLQGLNKVLTKHNTKTHFSDTKQELNEAITNFYIEIQKIKDSIIQMNDTNNVQYARDAVNIYTTTLMPLLHTIRGLKYDETFVWHNEYTNTCNLMQNKYSISNLSFSSSNDKVIAFDVGVSADPKKKRIIIESSSSSSSLEPENLTPGVELEPGQIPEPIYGDGLDGVIWNVPEYDRLWANLPTAIRTALITDTEWMKDFMSNCVAARASGQPCKFTGPRNLILPPEINPDGSVNFGVNVYNQAFASLDKNTQATYLTFYTEKDGVTNYNMLANAMNDLVAKMLQFGKGYF
jgi:hypothetical protein